MSRVTARRRPGGSPETSGLVLVDDRPNVSRFVRRPGAPDTPTAQLAKAIHPHFVTDRDFPRRRMYWRVSIDLSRPMVLSEKLDPVDGVCRFQPLAEGKRGQDDTGAGHRYQ